MIEENAAADMTAMQTDPESQATIEPALIEEWALAYLARYASSAENLRRVLLRRARRRSGRDSDAEKALAAAIDALLVRYRAAGLLDDAAYAAVQARRGLAHGRSLRRIAAGLARKGVAAADAAAVLAGLREDGGDPDLAAACAFARRRHLGPFRSDRKQPADRQRALAAFARAGFNRETAERILACDDEAAVATLLAQADRE